MQLTVFSFTLFYRLKNVLCQDEEFNTSVRSSISEDLVLLSGLDSILKHFRDNETSPLAKRILETFQKECLYVENLDVPKEKRRKPFIVIEGNHRPSRAVIGMRLSKLLGGRFMNNPAPCLAKFLKQLPKGTLLRRAFHMLSLYAQSFNVKVHLNLCRATILNGYWLDQLIFHLVQAFPPGKLPPVTSNIFKFPDDLLMPDVIFYLNIPDSLREGQMTTRGPLNWKPTALKLYQKLQSRYPIVFQKLTGIYRMTTRAMYQHIHEHLSKTRDVWANRRNIEFDYRDSVEEPRNTNETVETPLIS